MEGYKQLWYLSVCVCVFVLTMGCVCVCTCTRTCGKNVMHMCVVDMHVQMRMSRMLYAWRPEEDVRCTAPPLQITLWRQSLSLNLERG